METTKQYFSIFRKQRPSDAVSMACQFTAGVKQSIMFLTAALQVFLDQPIKLHTAQLSIDFFTWLIEHKKAGTTPHVFIDIGGPTVNWYRSDTGAKIYQTDIGGELVHRAVRQAACYGVTIDNAWHGIRKAGKYDTSKKQWIDTSTVGWWLDVPTFNPTFNPQPFTNTTTVLTHETQI